MPQLTELSGGRLRRRAAGIAAGKQAAAEKSAFQRTVAVHAAAAKTGRFAGGVKPRHDLAVAAEQALVEVGLESAQRLSGHDMEFHRNQLPRGVIENPLWFCVSEQTCADIPSRVWTVHHL